MSISPRFLDELRSRLTLSEVIGRKIKVTRAGREFKACCPFHHEKTPSFTINDDKQFYHCFGCGAHGDVIKFVMEHDNLGFMDTLESLAAQAGMQVPKPTPQAAAQAKKEKGLYELLEDATQFFENTLRAPRHADALEYLRNRGLSEETIKRFRIGFSPDDGQALRQFLAGQGYSDKHMIEAGVVRPSTRGGDPYAFFRDRVMFPVPDRRGRIVAFGGRILPDHLRPPNRSDFTPPKYINSSETPLFHKGRMLYGEPTARRAAADGAPLVLVEGYLDVIACVQAGIEGVLAPMGTAVTEEQIATMWQMIPDFNKVPVLCFDGDNAGRKAARRVADRVLPLLEPGRSVNFAFMPDGEDPDSLIKARGARHVRDILNKAMPLFDFIWNSHIEGRVFKTPEMRAGVIKQLDDEVAQIANKDVQVHYKSRLREYVSATFFPRRNFDRGSGGGHGQSRFGAGGFSARGGSGASQRPARPTRPQQQHGAMFSRVLMATIINHPHIFESVEEAAMGLPLPHDAHGRLRQAIAMYLSDNIDADRDKLWDHLENAGYSQEIRDICNQSVYIHASFSSPAARMEDALSSWLAYYEDGRSVLLEQELQERWKRAYAESSEDEEAKLKHLMSIHAVDNEAE